MKRALTLIVLLCFGLSSVVGQMCITRLTSYGKIGSQWSIADGKLLLKLDVPVNTRAIVYIPSSNAFDVQVENRPPSDVACIRIAESAAGSVVVEIRSGTYIFNSSITSK